MNDSRKPDTKFLTSNSKMLFRAAIVMLGMLLMLGLYLSISGVNRANAMDGTEWGKVKTYLNDYITAQIGTGGNEGEAGFIMSKNTLHDKLDNNVAGGDGTYLGEGDDAAGSPVLIDNLMGQTNMIPGTSFRCTYNTNCFDAANVTTVKNLVNAHEAAGFSTDIVDYCVSGHTEAATSGAWGFIAQTGGLGGSVTPKVYAFYFGRNGWTNTVTAWANDAAAAAPSSNTTYAAATPLSQCAGSTPDSELVRCTAAYALYQTTSGGSNTVTYNGQAPGGTTPNLTLSGVTQIVDVRTGISSTVSATGATSIAVPIGTVFDTGLTNIDPAKTTLIASRTPMMGGIVAEGTKMLGYPMAVGGFLNGGVNRWKGSLDVGQESSLPAYSTIAVAAYGSPAAVDTTAPTVTVGPSVTTTATSATITWTTSEPATSMIKYSTGGGPVTTSNDTVLHSSHSVTLNGLTEYTQYTYELDSYDGQANVVTQTPLTFDTKDVTGPVITNVSPADGATIYTDSTTISATLSDAGIGVDASASMIHVDGVMINSGCTASATSISCSKTGLTYGDHTIEVIASDLASPANTTTSTTTLHVGDNVAPTVGYTGPTGTSSNTAPTITGTVSDPSPSSGISATGTAFLSLDSGSTWPYSCTVSSGVVTCLVAGPLTGTPATTYHAQIKVTDNSTVPSANTGTSAVTDFTVDTTAPTVTANTFGVQPGNWTTDTTPTVSAAITGVPGGQHILDTATVSITGYGSCSAAEITYSDTTLSCTPSAPIAEGAHDVTFSAEYSTGHMGSDTQTINVDTTMPTITNLAPTGAIMTSTPTLLADLGDGTGVGVDTASVAVYLDSSVTPITPGSCTVTTSHVSCPASVTPGSHTFTVWTSDKLGTTNHVTSGTFTLTQINYFWTWYDDVGGDNWVMLANPSSASQNVYYDLSIGGTPSALNNGGRVGPGEYQAPRYGIMDGPVKATSTQGANGLLSQRTLWPKGGNSMEEVVATPESKLSDHYYWTWYDENSPGYRDWVLIANPSASAPVYAEIRIGGNLMTDSATGNQYFDIAAGQKVTPDFPGVIDGPVEVKAWTDSGKGTTAKVMASQRVLSNYGAAFNEVAGTPATDLKSDYLWTWYDGTAPGNRDWVLVANPGVSPVYAEIRIGGNLMTDSATGNQYFDIAAGQKVTPEFPGVIDGPVEVKAWTDSGKGTTANVIASQRVTWGPSFEEVPGMSAADLKPDYHWTWYDASVAGVRNWVLIANPSATEQIDYQVLIAGNPMATSSTNPGTILAGQRETPEFPGTIGGPVEVRAWVHGGTWNGNAGADNRNIMTSQRVLWKGFFNEVLGTSLS